MNKTRIFTGRSPKAKSPRFRGLFAPALRVVTKLYWVGAAGGVVGEAAGLLGDAEGAGDIGERGGVIGERCADFALDTNAGFSNAGTRTKQRMPPQ